MKQQFEFTKMTPAFGARQFVDFGSYNTARAWLRAEPLPRVEIRFQSGMPRVHEKQRADLEP